MQTFQAVYYRAPDGSEPVDRFIDRLSVKRQVVLDKQIARLNMLTPSNPHLPFPHSDAGKPKSPRAAGHDDPEGVGIIANPYQKG